MEQTNPVIKKLVNELGGNYFRFYRTIYKSTDCGPSIGFKFAMGWLYCEDLPSESPDDLSACAISVSSIVEGSDAEVPPTILDGDFTEQDFWKTLEEVNAEASYIWEEANLEDSEEPENPFRTTNVCPDYLRS